MIGVIAAWRPPVPVRIEDGPPGWLADLADWAIIATAAAAIGTLLYAAFTRRPRVKVAAERDLSRVYVHIFNEGGKPGAIRSVGLYKLSPAAGWFSPALFRIWHNGVPGWLASRLLKDPNAHMAIRESDDERAPKPFRHERSVVKPFDYEVVELWWPGADVYAASTENGQRGWRPASASSVRVVVQLHKGYRTSNIDFLV